MRAVSRTAALAGMNLFAAGAGFVTSVVVARGLGIEAFAVWTMALAWAGLLTIAVDLGFGVLLTRDAAAERRIGPLTGAALIARAVAFVPLAALFLAAAPVLGIGNVAPAAYIAIILIAVTSSVYSCLVSALRARPATMAEALAIDAAAAVGQCGIAFLIADGAGTAEELLLGIAAIQACQCAAAAAMWRVSDRMPERIEWASSPLEVWSAVRRSLPFATAGIAANLQLRVAPLLLGVMSTPAAVASFGAAARIGASARLLPQAAFGGVLPVLTEGAQSGAGRGEEFDRVLFWFAVPVSVAIAVGAGPIVAVVYGPAFAGATRVLFWVGVGLLPFLLNSGRRVLLYAAGREREAAWWTVCALLVQCAGCVILIPIAGAEGAAMALALGEAAVWWPLRRAPGTAVQRPLLSSPRRA